MKAVYSFVCKVKPWWFFNKEDLSPKRCPDCLSKSFYSVAKDVSDYLLLEAEYRCNCCDSVVQYWSYGNFDPAYLPPKGREEHRQRQNEMITFGEVSHD